MPSGSCLCGKVAFSFLEEPAAAAICHCVDCQKWGGGGFSSSVAVDTKNFRITQGTPKKFVRKGNSGLDHPIFFCGNCGTSLFVQPLSMDGTTLVRVGSLDGGALNIPVKAEFYTKDRRSYNTPVQGAQQNATMT